MRRHAIVCCASLALLGVAEAGEAPAPVRLEPGFTPILSGDTDLGFGFGGIGSLARFRPGCAPYCWRVEAMAYLTVRIDDGGAALPYHDYYVKLDLPDRLGRGGRLYAQLGFGRYSTSGYYGIGNASAVREGAAARFHQYDRIYPQLQLRARFALLPRLSLLLGGALTYNRISLYPGSQLEEDLARADPLTRSLLRGTRDHLLGELALGWIWDSRDHETAPTRGGFHELSWRASPALATDSNLVYGAVNATARFFFALERRARLVLALRLLADLLVGQPPFYELARHGGLNPSGTIGGGAAIRGVPLQRYHGKLKLLGNLELRAKLLPFRIRSQRFNLGLTAFVDAGRCFVDLRARPELDGSGLGLKLGLGGGARFQWGETFLLRADVAWSPDARPVGVYVDVGHVF